VIHGGEGEVAVREIQRKCCGTLSATGQAKYNTSQKMRAAEKLICSSLQQIEFIFYMVETSKSFRKSFECFFCRYESPVGIS